MSVSQYDGITVSNINSTDQKTVFAAKPYNYCLYRLMRNEKLHISDLASLTIFVLKADKEDALFIEEAKESLGRGDMAQAENSAVSLECRGDSVDFLVAGSSEAYSENSSVNIVRAQDIYKVTKPWGHELWINGEHPGYVLKEVKINAGTRTSLQYHRYKCETNVIFYGQARISYKKDLQRPNDEVKEEHVGAVDIEPITALDVRPDTLHRVEALTDVILYETSTPHLDDVIRIQDDAFRDNGRIMAEHGKKS